jgi:hypothetical protein
MYVIVLPTPCSPLPYPHACNSITARHLNAKPKRCACNSITTAECICNARPNFNVFNSVNLHTSRFQTKRTYMYAIVLPTARSPLPYPNECNSINVCKNIPQSTQHPNWTYGEKINCNITNTSHRVLKIPPFLPCRVKRQNWICNIYRNATIWIVHNHASSS